MQRRPSQDHPPRTLILFNLTHKSTIQILESMPLINDDIPPLVLAEVDAVAHDYVVGCYYHREGVIIRVVVGGGGGGSGGGGGGWRRRSNFVFGLDLDLGVGVELDFSTAPSGGRFLGRRRFLGGFFGLLGCDCDVFGA